MQRRNDFVYEVGPLVERVVSGVRPEYLGIADDGYLLHNVSGAFRYICKGPFTCSVDIRIRTGAEC